MAKFSQDFVNKVLSSVQESRKEEERARKVAEKAAQEMKSRVNKRLDEGWSFEDISKDSGADLEFVKSHAESTRPGYGVGKSNLEKAGDVAGSVASGIKDYAVGLGSDIKENVQETVGSIVSGERRGPGAEEIIKRQEAAQKLPADIQEQAKNLLSQDNLTLLEMVSQSKSEDEIRGFLSEATKRKTEADKKTIGTAAEVASMVPGGGGLIQAARQGTKQLIGTAATTTAAGAAGNVGSELRTNPEASGTDLLKSAAVGGAFGLGADVAVAGAGVLLSRNKGAGVTQVIDESRLLPERASSGADVITARNRLLEAGQQDPSLAVMSKGADIADVKKLKTIEKKIARAQQTSDITAKDARALLREREMLLSKIQNPNTPIASEIRRVDNQLDEKVGLGRNTRPLVKERNFLGEEAVREAAASDFAEFTARKPAISFSKRKGVSGVGQRAEAEAIANKLSQGYEGIPTHDVMNLTGQADEVVKFMNADFETAKRIAMGQQPPPQGIQASSFYEGVKSRAIRDRDTELMRQLATESKVLGQATEYGQFNAAFAYKDPESPVTAFRELSEARKKQNLPAAITDDEANIIVDLADQVESAKAAIANGGDRMAYGKARVAYDNYVSELKAAATNRNVKDALKHPVQAATNVAGLSKSLRASLDNSILFRQGWRTLFTHPKVWAKNSRKSFVDWVRAAGNRPVLDEVAADVISRENATNGLYKKMKLDLPGVNAVREEAFPITIHEKVPVAGRAFKGSDAAYTAWSQRTRADLADVYLNIAKNSGVDLTSKKELEAIGTLVNTLTGRGKLKSTKKIAGTVNNIFFSPRLLRSNWDVLTAHTFQPGTTSFVRKRAARNLLQIAVGSAAALKLASEVTGGEVEWDPRSSNFGKVKIGDTRFDLTGGMSSLATLGARLITREYKSSTTNETKSLDADSFGSRTGENVVIDFFANKFSPAAGVMRDYFRGQTFEGERVTPKTVAQDLTVPLIVDSYDELKNNPRAAAIVPSLIAEGLGVSVNTYGLDSNWNRSNAKRIAGFKEKVGKKKFEEANKDYNNRFNDWYNRVSDESKFWSLPQEKRENLVTSKRDALTEEVLESYGYKYKSPKSDRSTKALIKELERY